MIAAPGSSASRTSVPAADAEILGRVARPARSAASRASPQSISARRGTGCASIEAELARSPAHRQALRGHRQHDDEEHGVEDARCSRGRRRRPGRSRARSGTPPRRPAQARKPCSRSARPNGVVHTSTASGRATSTSAIATRIGASPSSSIARRRDEQAEQHEQPELREPGRALQEAAHDRRVRDARIADHEADEVGGQQTRAVQERDADGARQRDGHRDHGREPGRRQRQAAQQPDRRRCRRAVRRSPRCPPGGRAAAARRRCRSRLVLHSTRPITSSAANGSLSPLSASRTAATCRRTCVPRSAAKTAAASVEDTAAPSRSAVVQPRPMKAWAASATTPGGHEHAERGQQPRRAERAAAPPSARPAGRPRAG